MGLSLKWIVEYHDKINIIHMVDEAVSFLTKISAQTVSHSSAASPSSVSLKNQPD